MYSLTKRTSINGSWWGHSRVRVPKNLKTRKTIFVHEPLCFGMVLVPLSWVIVCLFVCLLGSQVVADQRSTLLEIG